MELQKDHEVYMYVKQHKEYISAVIHALVDGWSEECDRLRDKKSVVEAGFITLLDVVDGKKLSHRQKLCVDQAKDNCVILDKGGVDE